jgi:hypothetical protein
MKANKGVEKNKNSKEETKDSVTNTSQTESTRESSG